MSVSGSTLPDKLRKALPTGGSGGCVSVRMCVCGLCVWLIGGWRTKTAETVISRRECPAMRAGVINTVSPTTDGQLSGSCPKQPSSWEARAGGPSEVLPIPNSHTQQLKLSQKRCYSGSHHELIEDLPRTTAAGIPGGKEAGLVERTLNLSGKMQTCPNMTIRLVCHGSKKTSNIITLPKT